MTMPEHRENADTALKILDAAEQLFIERGFAATSMRAIATTAGVNLAAANYHFGSKKDLLAAVFQRRIEPINAERLKRLKNLKESEHPLTLRSVLATFLEPVIEAVNAEAGPAVMARLFGEPQSITQPVLEGAFSEVATAYRETLAELLPKISEEELHWRFHFTIGSMVHLLQFQAPLLREPSPELFNQGMQRLIDFVAAGLEQKQSN